MTLIVVYWWVSHVILVFFLIPGQDSNFDILVSDRTSSIILYDLVLFKWVETIPIVMEGFTLLSVA